MSQQMQYCDNCEKSFPESKMATHFGYCRRNIKRCPRCNDLYDINFQEDHDAEFHSHQPCPHCQLPILPSETATHQTKCNKKPRFCEYCELNIPFDTFPAHLKGCQSRTKICEKCNKNVVNKEYLNHIISCNGNVQAPLSYQHHIMNQQKILQENKFKSMERPQKRTEIQTKPDIKYEHRPTEKYEIKSRDGKEIMQRREPKRQEPQRQIPRKEQVRPQHAPIRSNHQYINKPHEVPRKPIAEHQPHYVRQPDIKFQHNVAGKIVGNHAVRAPEPTRVIYEPTTRVIYEPSRVSDPPSKFMKPDSGRFQKEQIKQYYAKPEKIPEISPIQRKKVPEERQPTRQPTIKPSVRPHQSQPMPFETVDSEMEDAELQAALFNSINCPKKTHLPFDSKDMPPEWMNESFIAKQNAIFEDVARGKRR